MVVTQILKKAVKIIAYIPRKVKIDKIISLIKKNQLVVTPNIVISHTTRVMDDQENDLMTKILRGTEIATIGLTIKVEAITAGISVVVVLDLAQSPLMTKTMEKDINKKTIAVIDEHCDY